MGETPLISVIVPVYNAEHFLKRCVDSIRSQTYKNFEIILIDDGSTDSSGMLCDNYQALDSRIRVIHKPNGGLSSARNAGLDICSGEYIAFVDSDDYIDSKMYESMLSCLEEENVDICVCQWQYELSDGQQVVDISKVNPNIFGKCIHPNLRIFFIKDPMKTALLLPYGISCIIIVFLHHIVLPGAIWKTITLLATYCLRTILYLLWISSITIMFKIPLL